MVSTQNARARGGATGALSIVYFLLVRHHAGVAADPRLSDTKVGHVLPVVLSPSYRCKERELHFPLVRLQSLVRMCKLTDLSLVVGALHGKKKYCICGA